MRIVVKNANEFPEVKEIKGTLENLQAIVGGYIQCLPVFDNVLCVCNEEGKILGLPENFMFMNDIIVGNVFFCAGAEEEFESLTDKQVHNVMLVMNTIERSRRINNRNK